MSSDHMIPEMYKIIDSKDTASVQKALQYLHSQALPAVYTTTVPTTGEVPQGAVVIHDNGLGTTGQHVYIRTGKSNVVTLAPPLATAANVTVAAGTLASAISQVNAVIAALQAVGVMKTV